MSKEYHIHWPGPHDPLGRLQVWERIEALIGRKQEAFSVVITTEGGEPRAFHFPAKRGAEPARVRSRRQHHRRRRW